MDELEEQRLRRLREALSDKESPDWARLSPRERDVLDLRVGLRDGLFRDIDEVALLYGVSTARIKMIETRALRKISKLHE